MNNQTLAEVQEGPSGHLTTKWEIALITVFVLIVLVILGTVWFQIQRNKRRRQQMLSDAELGAREDSRPRNREKLESGEVTTPDRVADIPRHPKYTRSIASSPSESSYFDSEHPPTKFSEPRYYWDSR